MTALDESAPVLFEYQNQQGLVAQYQATAHQQDQNRIHIELASQQTQCKASSSCGSGTPTQQTSNPQECCARQTTQASCCG